MSEVSRVQEPERARYFHDNTGVRWRVHPGGTAEMRGPNEPEWYESGATLAWLLAHLDIVEDAPASDYATAYASLHEVVRAFLAGERNTRYLRRLHAEIEAELTGGDRRGC